MVAAEESDSEEDGLETRPKKKSKTNSLPADDLDNEKASLAAAIAPAPDVYDNSFDVDDNFENDNEGLSEEDKSSHDTDKGEENIEDDDEMGHEDEGPLEVLGGGVDDRVSSVILLFYFSII